MGQLSVPVSLIYYVATFGISALIGKLNFRNRFLKFLLIVIPPLVLATIRYNVGYDYNSYIIGYYNSYGVTYGSVIDSYKMGDPILFQLLTIFATRFNSERVYLFLMALLTLVPGVAFIVREWDDTDIQPMIIFMYLFSPFIFSFSACKQGIALSILIFSMTYVYERKVVKFLLCVLIAFLFHSTSLAFIPVYFFLNGKQELSNFKKICIIGACLFVITNLEFVLGNVVGGKYEAYAVELVEGRNRTFWLYSLMAIVFVIFGSVLVRLDERNDLLIMMMVVGAMCQYLGFSNAFAKRIGEYFLMAQVFLLPQIPYMFTSGGRKLTKCLIIIYIIGIFYIANPVADSGMGFIPFYYKLY